MVTISIHGAEFFAYHGFYPEEQILGTQFIVDIDASFEPRTDLKSDELDDTLNYEQLYHIAEEQMKQTRKLIETVAQSIADEIKSRFSFTENIRVSVKKLHPPFKGKVEYSGVVISV
jgi:dihydroneopterin aldolase